VKILNKYLSKCYDSLNHYANLGVKTRKEHEEKVSSVVSEFVQKHIENSIWLDEKTLDSVNEALAVFRRTEFAILLKLPDDELKVSQESYPHSVRTIPWKELNDKYKEAREKLLSLIEKEKK